MAHRVTTMRIDPDVYDAVDKTAHDLGMTFTGYVNYVLLHTLEATRKMAYDRTHALQVALQVTKGDQHGTQITGE